MIKYSSFSKRMLTSAVLCLTIVSLAACTGTTPTPTPTVPTQTGSPPPVSTTPTLPPTSNIVSPASPTVPVLTPPPAPTAPVGSPSIVILSPSDFVGFHEVVVEQGLKIAVQVSNFKLVDKIGQAPVSGEGHINHSLDAVPPTTPGVSAVSPGGSFLTTAASTITWGDLPKGAHKVSAQLVNNDNTPLVPPVIDSAMGYMSFVIGAPNIKIVSPVIGATIPAGNITVQVAIRDFINAYNPTKPNVAGEGHIVYYMDVDPAITTLDKAAFTAAGTYNSTAATSYTWQNVTPGVHTFSVQLVNHDSTLLTNAPSAYPAVDGVKVIVQ